MTTQRTMPVTEADISALQNICMVAASRFDDNAAYMRKQSLVPTPAEGSMQPTGAAARALAEQFESHSAEARSLLNLFANAAPFNVPLIEDTDVIGA